MVGVMAAYCLRTCGSDVVLVERNHIGTGDSGFTTAVSTRVPDAAAARSSGRYGRGFLRECICRNRRRSAVHHEPHSRTTHRLRPPWPATPSTARTRPAAAVWPTSGMRSRVPTPGIRFLSEPVVPPAARPCVEWKIVIEDEARFHVRKFLVGLIDAAGAAAPGVGGERLVQSVDPGEIRVRGGVEHQLESTGVPGNHRGLRRSAGPLRRAVTAGPARS